MPVASIVQSDFSVGEIAPELHSSVAFEKYRKAVAILLNWIPTLQGDLIRRPGTQFIGEVKDSTSPFAPRLLPFVYSTSQSYVVELGSFYARFFTSRDRLYNSATFITGVTKASPAVVTSANHGLTTGQTAFISNVAGMTQVNNVTTGYVITRLTANTFSLNGVNSTGFGAYTSGGSVIAIYEIPSPYGAGDVDQLQIVQSADTVYIAHPNYPPYKLVRNADGSFVFVLVAFEDGPYLDVNDTATTMTLSGTTVGLVVDVRTSAAVFSGGDVGRLIRFFAGGVWGWLMITQFISSIYVLGKVMGAPGSGAATANWRLGRWSDTTGWPTCVEFHEGRLWWSGSLSAPDTLDGSQSADFENMAPSLPSGTVQDTSAIAVTLASGNIEQAIWLKSTQRGLLVGTRGAEFLVSPGTNSDFLKPSSTLPRRQSTYGSAAVAPVAVGRAVLFVQRSSLKIREAQYYFSVDGFEAEDITILARHVTESGIKEMAFTRDPFPILWCVRNDGQIAACTYERDQQVLRAGWHRHQLGGFATTVGDPAVVERITSIPNTFTSIAWGANYSYDELWMVSRRVINGSRRRYIELLNPQYLGGGTTTPYRTPALAFNVDCGQTLNNGYFISGVANTSPRVTVTLTVAPNNFVAGANIVIDGVLGASQLNGKVYQAAAIVGNDVTLNDTSGNPVDGALFSPFLAGTPGSFYGLLFPQYSSLDVNANFESNYLEGQTIGLAVNGGAQSGIVLSGNVPVSPDGGFFTWGFNYNSDLKMLRQEVGSSNGTSTGKSQRTHAVAVRRYLEGNLRIGLDFVTMDLLDEVKSPPPGVGRPLESGWVIKRLPKSTPNREEQLCFRLSEPLPATITAISLQIETQDAL